jgi:hypothetical protein
MWNYEVERRGRKYSEKVKNILHEYHGKVKKGDLAMKAQQLTLKCSSTV